MLYFPSHLRFIPKPAITTSFIDRLRRYSPPKQNPSSENMYKPRGQRANRGCCSRRNKAISNPANMHTSYQPRYFDGRNNPDITPASAGSIVSSYNYEKRPNGLVALASLLREMLQEHRQRNMHLGDRVMMGGKGINYSSSEVKARRPEKEGRGGMITEEEAPPSYREAMRS